MHPSVRRWLIRTVLAATLFGFGVAISLLDIFNVALDGWAPLGVLLQIVAVLSLIFFAVRFILRRLLWRVGRRLLVSYLLLGFVPLPLLLILGWGALWIGSAHVAAYRVDHEIDRAVLELRNLMLEAEADLAAGTAADEPRILKEFASQFPGIELIHRRSGGPAYSSGDSDPEEMLPAGRVFLDLVAIGVVDQRADLMVVERTDRGVLLGRIPFEPELRRLIEARTRVSLGFPSADRRFGDVESLSAGQEGVTISRREGREEETAEPREGNEVNVKMPDGSQETLNLPKPPHPGVGGVMAWPLVFMARTVPYPYIDWEAEDWHQAMDTEANGDFIYFLRSSFAREAVELAGEEGVEINRNVSLVLMTTLSVVALSTVVLWFGAALLAAFLVWRIARATDRLAVAFGKLEEGHFDHRAKLRGDDQLSGLIEGYNRMARHLEEAVDERAEREVVDRELATARALQQSLLPAADFSYPGLGIATYFEPAQAIGGDFYHFQGGESRLDVVVADVSGHGLGTGIVMAAAKTLLSALSSEDPETVDLFQRMDRQLLSTTESRTFVTLVHCRFDLERRVAEVTNAGHVPPYRVRPSGSVTSLPASARPLGLSLPAEFRTHATDLESGDLWVLLSDGIIEARSKAGDLLGFERWETLLSGVAGLQAEEARNLLLEKLGAFVGDEDQEDDLTLLVVRIGDFATDDKDASGSDVTS